MGGRLLTVLALGPQAPKTANAASRTALSFAGEDVGALSAGPEDPRGTIGHTDQRQDSVCAMTSGIAAGAIAAALSGVGFGLLFMAEAMIGGD